MNNNSAVTDSESLSLSAAPLTAVYVGKETQTGVQFLMRRAEVQPNAGLPQTLLKEAYYLKTLESSYVCALRDIVQSTTSVFFLTEDCGRSLSTIFTTLRPQSIPKIAFGLLQALEFLQERRVAHLGLQPDCVFVSEQGNVRLDGFYYARRVEAEQRNVSQESHFDAYSSPELLHLASVPSHSSDMWSFGLIFLSLLQRAALSPVHTREDLLRSISALIRPGENQPTEQKLRKVVPNIGQMERDLLEKVLRIDPMQRLTACKAMQHPYFSSVRSGIEPLEAEE